MIYLYHRDAGEYTLTVEGEEYRHLFKAKRLKATSEINLRNLKDDYLYRYIVESIDRKRAILSLIDKSLVIVAPKKELHIGWCIIDTKVLERYLPALNEIGVSKITPLICDRSQRNFKIDMDRVERILINSSQQCGRSQMMEISPTVSIDEFIKEHSDCFILDFSELKLKDKIDEVSNIIIGCEGGFTDRERSLFSGDRVVGLDTSSVLRSETAAVSVASIVLL